MHQWTHFFFVLFFFFEPHSRDLVFVLLFFPAVFLIMFMNRSTSHRLQACSALTSHVTFLKFLKEIPDESPSRRDKEKMPNDIQQSLFLSSGHIGLCSHACLTKGPTELLFRALSDLAIFQQRPFCSCLFLSHYLHCHDISLPVYSEEKKGSFFSFVAKIMTSSPSCASVPSLAFRKLVPSFLAIARSQSCTCPQRPIWKQTPPIFNSSLFIFICHHVRAELHSVASPSPATFADFPHMQACPHMQTHTRAHAHIHTHSHTHKLNTQTHAKFQPVSST